MASRSLDDLEPETRRRVLAWIGGCRSRGVDVLVYCTLRSAVEQQELYARGRTTPGPRVTDAPAWASWHNYGRAVDAVPLVGGKPEWKYNSKSYNWRTFADEARKVGLEWAGNWPVKKGHVREFCHLQHTGGLSLAQAYAAISPRQEVADA